MTHWPGMPIPVQASSKPEIDRILGWRIADQLPAHYYWSVKDGDDYISFCKRAGQNLKDTDPVLVQLIKPVKTDDGNINGFCQECLDLMDQYMVHIRLHGLAAEEKRDWNPFADRDL